MALRARNVMQRKALLEHEARGRVTGLRAHHGEIVHRPGDREPADVATRAAGSLRARVHPGRPSQHRNDTRW
jgi:hypothetical protein